MWSAHAIAKVRGWRVGFQPHDCLALFFHLLKTKLPQKKRHTNASPAVGSCCLDVERRCRFPFLMALAAAAAAAPSAEPVTLTAVPEVEVEQGAVEHLLITLPRAADGSLGLVVGSDDDGRVVVKVGRGDVQTGDVIVSIDGTATPTIQRYEQELVHMYATGVGDAVRLRVTRFPALEDVVEWKSAALTLATGEEHSVELIALQPSLGKVKFACVGSGHGISCELRVAPPGGDASEQGEAACEGQQVVASGGDAPAPAACSAPSSADDVLSLQPSANGGEGTFRVPMGHVATATFANAHASGDVTLQASLTLTPVAQALKAETAKMRAALASQEAHVEMLFKHEQGLLHQEMELQRRLQALRYSRQAVSDLRASDEAVYDQLRAAVTELAHLAMPGSRPRTHLAGAGSEQEDTEASHPEVMEGAPDEEQPPVHEVADAEGESGFPSSAEGGDAAPSMEAIERTLAAAKQMRAEAYEGRRTFAGRVHRQEERLTRAQVINFYDGGSDEGLE